VAEFHNDDALAARKMAVEAKAAEMVMLLQAEAAINGHDAARIASDGALLGIMRWFGTLSRGHELVAKVCEEFGAEAERFMALEEAANVPAVLQ
jgi:hypothetical protein